MARDHYVRVVYRGFLFPFGHRVALVKVSERKFHKARGTASHRRQHRLSAPALFIVVRERERTSTIRPADQHGRQVIQRQLPFSSVRLAHRSDAQPRSARRAASASPGSWPDECSGRASAAQPFAFQCVAIDLDGRTSQFELPMIFMDNTIASPRTLVGNKLAASTASRIRGADDAHEPGAIRAGGTSSGASSSSSASPRRRA